ncbi:MAG: hypothetical protein ACRD1V_08340 [Vicinamibacterales bacterium]
MTSESSASQFRFEKRRAAAIVTIVGGEAVRGSFFTAAGDTRHDGGERIGDLLNSDSGFFPFEIDAETSPRTVLYNRAHVITVALFDDEAKRDAGYSVARRRQVTIVLSNVQRLRGVVLIYRPEGRDRLSDWARQPGRFRYVETADTTLIVNADHIVAITEATDS